MDTFDFTLTFFISQAADLDLLAERLHDAGCDDAIAGTGRPGFLALGFSRAAPSFDAARQSALEDVRRALPEARLASERPGAA